MNPDEPPAQRIWSCLRAIHCDAGSAQAISSDLAYSLSEMFWYLSPLSGQKTITDDMADFEKAVEAIENAADSAAADLADIHRYTRLIRGALSKMRKEAENGEI